jgi:hypothetical protein
MKRIRSIAELKTDWINLHDLDRAQAVKDLHEAGDPIRQIAAHLQKPESSLRRLLTALDAPVEDRALARRGLISTNELVRRAKAEGSRRAARNREEIRLERERHTLRAADRICKWLLETQMNGPSCEMIVNEVRRKLHGMAQAGLHPTRVAPPDTPIDEIIEQTRPPAIKDDCIDVTGWYAQWLIRWTFFAFPDEDIRDNALDLALEKQWGR